MVHGSGKGGTWSHIFPIAAQGEESFPAPQLGPSHGELCMNFSNRSPSCVQQSSTNCSSIDHCSKGCSPSGKTWSYVGSTRVIGPTRKPALVWALLSTGLQVPAKSTAFPPVHSLFRHPLAPAWGSSVSCRWTSVPLLTSMGCRATAASPWSSPIVALLQHLSTSSPSFFTDLKCLHSCLLSSLAAITSVQYFFLLLNYVFTEVLLLFLISLTLASGGSILEPAGIDSAGHRVASSSFKQKPIL